jgi:long-subunit acyl-CoA synthetase (AMP-forming)
LHFGHIAESKLAALEGASDVQYLATDKPYPRGEVQIKGTNITSGYYRRPDKTSEAFD